MKRLAWCLSLVSLLGACGSSGHSTTPGSTSATSGGANTTTTSTGIPHVRGLRGFPVRNFECPPHAMSSGARPIPIEAVQALLLCPLSMPGVSGEAVTVRADQPIFNRMISALSAADEPSIGGGPCPAYADLLQVVLAKTSGSAYEVSIPTDACGHYQPAALDALSRARGTSPDQSATP